jgi:hypothetical protein
LSKVILVLSDGLRYDTAVAGMGTLGHLVEVKLARLYKVISEFPSVSGIKGIVDTPETISQLQIAPTSAKSLG